MSVLRVLRHHLSLRLAGGLGLALSIGMVAGCLGGVSNDTCRLRPEDCRGAAGTLCDSDNDCSPGLECCDDDKNCGGGMCTLPCDDDLDCPSDMLCEHDVCFYMCESDEDCAPTMSCEHGNTICEYE